MSVTTRGVKNAFRNTIRSISITAILALTIALALVMLLSLKAVQARIDDVKASVGNTVTVTPAGARGFQGGGEPLTAAEITKIQNTAHVKSVTSTLEDRWITEGTTAPTRPDGRPTRRHARACSRRSTPARSATAATATPRAARPSAATSPTNFSLPGHRHRYHRARQHAGRPT